MQMKTLDDIKQFKFFFDLITQLSDFLPWKAKQNKSMWNENIKFLETVRSSENIFSDLMKPGNRVNSSSPELDLLQRPDNIL